MQQFDPLNRPVTLSAQRTYYVGLPSSVGRSVGLRLSLSTAQTDTRLVSINHQRSDSAAEEKSPPNEGALARSGGREGGRRAGAASNESAPFKTRRANRQSH